VSLPFGDYAQAVRRTEECDRLRATGMLIEQAMVLMGHNFVMWHLRFSRPGRVQSATEGPPA
jgi:hypothetical protein